MAAAAVADCCSGSSPRSGKLPVTFTTRAVAQSRSIQPEARRQPPSPETAVTIDDIPVRAPQTSIATRSYHLDAGTGRCSRSPRPLVREFEYSNCGSTPALQVGEVLTAAST